MNFYYLFGKPVGHSLSPQLHQIIYEAAGIQATYKKIQIEADQIPAVVQGMKALQIGGANITIPYKQSFFAEIDHLSDLARRLDSVNTLNLVDGQVYGYNTDYDGILFAFKRAGWQIKDKSVYILGSGGASMTMAYVALDQGAKSVTVVSRSGAKGVTAEADWKIIDYEELANRSGHILVNGTPVGMYPQVDQSPVGSEIIQQFDRLFDMTYNPRLTKFLVDGQAQAKEIMNGLEMLIGQAIKAVEIWEDREIDDQAVAVICQKVRELVYGD